MAKEVNTQEDKDFSENFEKFKAKKNNKWAKRKKFKNKKKFIEDVKEDKWK